MEKNNENINITIHSLDGLKRPELSPLMADRIWKLAIQNPNVQQTKTISSKKVVLWCSGLAAIVILNIAFLNWNENYSNLKDSQMESSISSLYFDSEISY